MSGSKTSRITRVFVRYVLPVLVLLGSARLAKTLIESKAEPRREEHQEQGVLVDVVPVSVSSQRIDILAQGTVIASREMMLQPQVTGRIVWQSEALTPGGLLAQDEDVVRIERSDYRLQVQMREAELERARAALELEEGRGVVAEQEWNLFREDIPEDEQSRSLALREPQRRDAMQAVELAETRLDQAQLELRRTTVTAPFNAFIQSESVEVGQLVTPQARLATLVGTDAFWVQVSIPVERVSRIDIPGVNAEVGSPARVWHELGGERVEREGRVVRLLPDLDPVGRMARILVTIDDPMGLQRAPGEAGLPLLLGSFVNVEIEGNRLYDVIEIPRLALREGDRVFVMTPENTLEIRAVEIVWRRPDTVLVSSGLSDGERVVTSRMSAPVAGMQLRTEPLPPPGEPASQPSPERPQADLQTSPSEPAHDGPPSPAEGTDE